MTAPDFNFNEKTGELQHGGKLIPLSRLHAEMFACLVKAHGPITAQGIAVAVGQTEGAIRYEMPAFRGRLSRVHIRIASSGGSGGKGGYWLVFEEPRKWKPNVPAEIPFQ